TCVQQARITSGLHDQDRSDTSGIDPDDYRQCSESGQAPGTFVELMTGKSIGYKHTVASTCPLSSADEATLAKLPAEAGPAPGGPPDSGGAHPPPPAQPMPYKTYIRPLDSLGGGFMLTKVSGPAPGTSLVTGMPLSMVDKTLERVENTEHVV